MLPIREDQYPFREVVFFFVMHATLYPHLNALQLREN